MENIKIQEIDKKRIQKFIKQKTGFYGYEQDIELLEQNGQITDKLARKVFTEIMDEAYRTRTILEPEENSEFKEEIEEAFAHYDKIPKPEELEQYGFYDGAYNNMELDDIYANMQIAFELRELDDKYYRCRDLRNVANTAINSIDGIEKYQIELQTDTKEELQKIKEELTTLLSAEKTDIQTIQERIELYNGHVTNIWNDYLTDIGDVENSQYRWVIHNLTKGELEGNFRNKYMSTSLMTNNAMGKYGNSDYGLIVKPKHIVCASYKDTYTLNTRDDEENLFNIRPPLMLPQEIEDICIQQTIEENGEMLNYETTPIYSELVVDEYEIEGVYYISYGEHEFAKDYERAKKVADERGLPLIERDISKYRTEHGLEPMTENAQMNLCRNILWKCCTGDRELEQAYSQCANRFIKSNFKDFYEKFMQLKENTEISKEDILRSFADVARGDRHFGKISQNIDEMYLSEELKAVYLQLRLAGLEYELYKGIDLNNINYSELLERATKVLEEKAKADEIQPNISDESAIVAEESIIQPPEETIAEVHDFSSVTAKTHEQQQSEKIKPQEESIRDEVGDEFKKTEQEIQKIDNPTVDLWMNRFSNWYTSINRVPQNVKAKFVKMKSDIIKVISGKIKERSNEQEINKNQDQNER